MKIRDYDIVKDIEILFCKRIVIYGAGNDGKELLTFFKSAEMEIDCFCDRNVEKTEYLGYKVISLSMLKEKAEKEDCLIIIASSKYREEIVKDIESAQIEAYVCTDRAIYLSFDFHVEDNKRLNDSWINFYKEKRNNYVYCKIIRKLLNNIENIYSQFNPVLVYLPRKVGSSTVSWTLAQNGIKNIHIHWLINFDYFINMQLEDGLFYNLNEQGKFIKHHSHQLQLNGYKIVTLIRDPIARAISEYVQDVSGKRFIDKSEQDFEQEYKKVIFSNLINNQEFEWFNQELREFTGIDIFKYSFDKENGYGMIKEGNIEILVLTLEKLNENQDILGAFVGVPNLKLENVNIADEKDIKYIYQGIKDHIRFPRELVESQYMHNDAMKHFYSIEDRVAFMKKWEKNIE